MLLKTAAAPLNNIGYSYSDCLSNSKESKKQNGSPNFVTENILQPPSKPKVNTQSQTQSPLNKKGVTFREAIEKGIAHLKFFSPACPRKSEVFWLCSRKFQIESV